MFAFGIIAAYIGVIGSLAYFVDQAWLLALILPGMFVYAGAAAIQADINEQNLENDPHHVRFEPLLWMLWDLRDEWDISTEGDFRVYRLYDGEKGDDDSGLVRFKILVGHGKVAVYMRGVENGSGLRPLSGYNDAFLEACKKLREYRDLQVILEPVKEIAA